jgi:superfamily II RNA helicase
MVKICDNIYPIENESKYIDFFEKYSFELSSFQKFAIEAIVEGNHILVTAHTGSGKTLPAEFAIEYFVSRGKKVIYTSPIKALSNQKFHEFSQKFPEISFGILTGDIKTNPEADVLIMTTEILMNTLYTKQRQNNNNNSNLLSFDMDFDNDLACVVFDEIHYINDSERGRVWEETIMMLPKNIQMVMLSATLDSPENFALWCETCGRRNNDNNKIVYLTTTYKRVVPLTHYSYITCTQGIFKIIKDKQLEIEIMKQTNKLHVLQDSNGNFNDVNYNIIKKTLNIFKQKDHFVKRQHVLNSVSKHMVEHNMLPAICFVLNRKLLEQCASEVTTNLLEDDSKVPYIMKNECEKIIRKLPNYHEYLNLPEYVKMVSLLEKGIAIHHAGIMPVLREMVEILFSKGYIKLLFATETFAVGINMPTKTVLFTNLNKFDGSNMRPLLAHEYTQMAGRAGRRGIDTVGNVIHLTNLFETDQPTLRTMMRGKPQLLESKFKISYNLLLNLIDIGEDDYSSYVKESMIQREISNELSNIINEINNCENDLKNMEEKMKTPIKTMEEYIELQENKKVSVNKKRKEIEKSIQKVLNEYPNIDKELTIGTSISNKKTELVNLKIKLNKTRMFVENKVKNVIELLKLYGMINNENKLTTKGNTSTHIRELHCLVFSELIESGKLQMLNSEELVALFSCFTNISVSNENKTTILHENIPNNVLNIINNVTNMYEIYENNEKNMNVDTGMDYNIHYDLINYVISWCNCVDYNETKLLLQQIECEKEIFLGEFVKAILKINNISSELEKIAELKGDLEFLKNLKQIPQLTLKYVATNQSLYV